MMMIDVEGEGGLANDDVVKFWDYDAGTTKMLVNRN